jgi:peptide chain release factor subunit 1
MKAQNRFRELLKLQDTVNLFFSLYLDTRWKDEQQRERVRIFTKNKLAEINLATYSPAVQQSLEHDKQRIEAYVEALIKHALPGELAGVALFACSAHAVFLTYGSTIPFENQCTLATHPYVVQLACVGDEYENALVVMVDTESARILEMEWGEILSELDIENEVPGRHKQGGWSQMRFQRHIQDLMERHHKEVADQVVKRFNRGISHNVILCGQDHILSSFRSFLPERVQERIIAKIALDINTPDALVHEKTLDLLRQHERQKEEDRVRHLIGTAKAGGLAVLRLYDTLEALNKRVVQLLMINKTFLRWGWRCPTCNLLGEQIPLGCPLCGGELTTVDLKEEMVWEVFRQDGEVDFVMNQPALEQVEGVGALLRFR